MGEFGLGLLELLLEPGRRLRLGAGSGKLGFGFGQLGACIRQLDFCLGQFRLGGFELALELSGDLGLRTGAGELRAGLAEFSLGCFELALELCALRLGRFRLGHRGGEPFAVYRQGADALRQLCDRFACRGQIGGRLGGRTRLLFSGSCLGLQSRNFSGHCLSGGRFGGLQLLLERVALTFKIRGRGTQTGELFIDRTRRGQRLVSLLARGLGFRSRFLRRDAQLVVLLPDGGELGAHFLELGLQRRGFL